MNPVLSSSYSRAMQAALAGSGYAGAQPPASKAASAFQGRASSKRALFDFTVDHLPNHPIAEGFEEMFEEIRKQDWSTVFLVLLGVLGPAGFVVFLIRDRYYRRRGTQTIQLTLSAN